MTHASSRPARIGTLRRWGAASLLGAGLVLGSGFGAGVASAHDSVITSTPASGAEITALPDALELEFSAEPREGFNSMALSRNGEVLFSGEPQVEGRMLSLDVPDSVTAEAGDYTLGYQITSSDGHATRGAVEFRVAPGTGAAASTSAAPATTGAEATTVAEDTSDTGAFSSGLGSLLLKITGIVVCVGALFALWARRRHL